MCFLCLLLGNIEKNISLFLFRALAFGRKFVNDYEYYQKIQAKHYEELSISNKEEHFEYTKKILGYIRVLENNTIKIPISYNLDEEHGLELKIVNNKVEKVDGIDET